MTNQEAIVTIRHVIDRIQWDYPMECAVALDMAVEALKREIPVKPGICGNQNDTWWYACPMCKRAVDRDDVYCGTCGSRLK